jgi:hypothetical protein
MFLSLFSVAVSNKSKFLLGYEINIAASQPAVEPID